MSALLNKSRPITVLAIILCLAITSASGVIGSSGMSATAAQVAAKCCAQSARSCCGASCCPVRTPSPDRSPLQTERPRLRTDDLRVAVARWILPKAEPPFIVDRWAYTAKHEVGENRSLQIVHVRLQI